MRRFLCFCVILADASVVLQAQPVIHRNDLMVPGDLVRAVVAVQVPHPGPAGTMVHWDFSGVQEGSGGSRLNVATAQSTPYFNLFPASNLAFVDGSLTPQYYQYNLLNNLLWEDHGHVVPSFYELKYHGPRTMMVFPCTYNTQWNDNYAYTIDYLIDPPVSTEGQGTLQAIADGYGSLSLPQGTFSNTLRTRTIAMSTDMTLLGPGLFEQNTIRDTVYTWLTPDYHTPLCTYARSIIHRRTMTVFDTLDEVFDVSSFTFDNTAEPVSSVNGATTQQGIDVRISPNPFAQELLVGFVSHQGGMSGIAIYDMPGNTVHAENILVIPGKNTHRLTIPPLPPGPYLLVLQNGEHTVTKLIICIGST